MLNRDDLVFCQNRRPARRPWTQGLERIGTTWTAPSRSEPREARQCMGPATACQPKRTNTERMGALELFLREQGRRLSSSAAGYV